MAFAFVSGEREARCLSWRKPLQSVDRDIGLEVIPSMEIDRVYLCGDLCYPSPALVAERGSPIAPPFAVGSIVYRYNR